LCGENNMALASPPILLAFMLYTERNIPLLTIAVKLKKSHLCIFILLNDKFQNDYNCFAYSKRIIELYEKYRHSGLDPESIRFLTGIDKQTFTVFSTCGSPCQARG